MLTRGTLLCFSCFAQITMFAVTPWLPQLIFMFILYLMLNKYFAGLLLCTLVYWYLRKEPKTGADDGKSPDACGADTAGATASALAATAATTDAGRKSSKGKESKDLDVSTQKATADKKAD